MDDCACEQHSLTSQSKVRGKRSPNNYKSLQDASSYNYTDDNVINEHTTFLLCRPHGWVYQLTLISLMGGIYFATFFIMEVLTGLEKIIVEVKIMTLLHYEYSFYLQVLKVDIAKYNLLYSIYYWPTVILAPLGGILIDKVFGVRLATMLFLMFCIIGQSLLSVGVFVNHYWLMLLGRFIAGAGGEMIIVCIATYDAIFFMNKINAVNALLLAAARLGATSAVNVNGIFYDLMSFIPNHHSRLGCVLFIGVLICMIALIASIILAYMYTKAKYNVVPSTQNIKCCHSLFNLSFSFWLTITIAGIFYAAVLSPVSIGELYYVRKYGISLAMANLINGLVYFIPIVLSPILGLIIDRIGFNPMWILLSISIGIFHHLFFAFSGHGSAIPYIASICGGISYSLFTISLFPMTAMIVKPEQLGTGYGIQEASVNFFQSSVTVIAGLVVDRCGYFMVQIFYACLSFMGLAVLFVLIANDMTLPKLYQVNVSGWKRRQLKSKLSSAQ